MPRFLAVLVLSVIGWAPGSAIALSLGDIDLQSALNQPFVAEIPVATESVNDIGALTVDLAPSATFEQYGLDRAAFLEDFNFEIIRDGANGIVRITSLNPVVEPFVTLLLEIRWPQGRLLREYTVLLDPPVFAAEAVTPAVEAPKAGPAPAPAPGPTRVVPPAQAQPAAPSAPTQTAAPAARAQPAPMPAGDSYGPVQRSETLWGIAGRYADAAGVNRNQMMLAIYRANPEAFVGNINRLKAGMILRVPDPQELQRLTRTEATAEVRRQNQQWRGDAEDAGQLRLVPPPDVEDAGEPVGAGAGPAVTAGDDRELQQQVRRLESELEESRRLIELRDEQLQALQNQLAEADQAVLPGVEEPLVEEPVAGEPVAEEPLVEEPAVAEPVDEEPVVEEPMAPPVDVVTTQPAEEPGLIGGLLTNIWLYVGLGAVLILALFVVRRRSAEPDAPPWSRLEDDDRGGEEAAETTQQLAATPTEEVSFVVEESVAEQTDQDQVPFAPDVGHAATGEFATDQDIPETPLERTISTDSPVNLDEADPIAEADFHMAYGLYDQAADLLSNSLNSEPDRKDLRLKLLEVYFIWENQGGFLREARELRTRVLDESDADWNKVLIMGKQICPDEELFAASPSAAGAADDMDFALTDESAGGDGDSIDFDFSETSSDDAFGEDDGELDFDLSADDLGTTDDAADDELDFDISEAEDAALLADEDEFGGDPTMESPIQPPSSESTMETPTIESPTLDPTIESPIEPPAGESTMETPTVESEALEPTMETPTIETPIGGWDENEADAAGSEQTAEIELDDLGLDLSDLGEGEGEAVTSGDEGGDEEPEDAGLAAETLQIEVDSLESLDDDTQQRKLPEFDAPVDEDLVGIVDVEATGEMPGLGDTAEQPVAEDTAEHPQVPDGGDTAEQPGLAEPTVESAEISDEVDFDVGDSYADSDQTTSVVPEPATIGDGATMTEVGTKLDLARAYIDMGDPDGARSILNEVLEEATDDQRQEAQKLLDDLED